MRGSHHIVAGLAMLGIGRAAILMGESADHSQVIQSFLVLSQHG